MLRRAHLLPGPSAVVPACLGAGLTPPSLQECIVTSLLSQKKDIKRQNLLLERMRATEEDELQSARAAARERVLKEFEHAQSGLSSKATAGKVMAGTQGNSNGEKEGEARGTKRKFDLDQDEMERLAKEGEDEALKRTALELAEARRAKLPNFWLVSCLCCS